MSEDIGGKIKKIRDSYNLSQERFARRLGISGKTISAYETGRNIPPLRVLEKIMETYDAPNLNLNEGARKELENKLSMLEDEISSIKKMFVE